MAKRGRPKKFAPAIAELRTLARLAKHNIRRQANLGERISRIDNTVKRLGERYERINELIAYVGEKARLGVMDLEGSRKIESLLLIFVRDTELALTSVNRISLLQKRMKEPTQEAERLKGILQEAHDTSKERLKQLQDALKGHN